MPNRGRQSGSAANQRHHAFKYATARPFYHLKSRVGTYSASSWGLRMATEQPNCCDVTEAAFLPISFTLKDGRSCRVRLVTEADAREVCELLPRMHAESDFLMYMPGEFDFTVEQEAEYIRGHIQNDREILITAELDGRFIAFAGATSRKFKRQQHRTEFGVTVAKAFWGLGLGRKMSECIVEWARRIGLRKLYLDVFADNDRAIAIYRSLGFEEEGRFREDVLRADGSYSDVLIMAALFKT